MLRNFSLAMVLSSLFVSPSIGIDLIWDGGSGEYASENWNGGKSPEDVVGRNNGIESVGNHMIISGPGDVIYDGEANGDFRVLQGSDMTITDGASWTQITFETWSENRWTEMDLSNLRLDDGIFRRTGGGPPSEPSGGALIFGSWKGMTTLAENRATANY